LPIFGGKRESKTRGIKGRKGVNYIKEEKRKPSVLVVGQRQGVRKRQRHKGE